MPQFVINCVASIMLQHHHMMDMHMTRAHSINVKRLLALSVVQPHHERNIICNRASIANGILMPNHTPLRIAVILVLLLFVPQCLQLHLLLQQKKRDIIKATLGSEEELTDALSWEDIQELLQV